MDRNHPLIRAARANLMDHHPHALRFSAEEFSNTQRARCVHQELQVALGRHRFAAAVLEVMDLQLFAVCRQNPGVRPAGCVLLPGDVVDRHVLLDVELVFEIERAARLFTRVLADRVDVGLHVLDHLVVDFHRHTRPDRHIPAGEGRRVGRLLETPGRHGVGSRAFVGVAARLVAEAVFHRDLADAGRPAGSTRRRPLGVVFIRGHDQPSVPKRW